MAHFESDPVALRGSTHTDVSQSSVLPVGRRPQPGPEPTRRIVKSRVREVIYSVLHSRAWTFFALTCLSFSLLAKDVWLAVPMSSEQDNVLYALLGCVGVLFVLELAGAVFLTRQGYVRTAFFIIDCVSIVSVFAELVALKCQFATRFWTVESSLLRCLCFLKLMKFTTYLGGSEGMLPLAPKGYEEEREGVAYAFRKTFAIKMPVCVVLFVALVPFVRLEWNMNRAQLSRTWLYLLVTNHRVARHSGPGTADGLAFQRTIDRMEAFFEQETSARLVAIEGFPNTFFSGGHQRYVEGRLSDAVAQRPRPVRPDFVLVEDFECPDTHWACADLPLSVRMEISIEEPIRKSQCESAIAAGVCLAGFFCAMAYLSVSMHEMERLEREVSATRDYTAHFHSVDLSDYGRLGIEDKGVLQLMGMARPSSVHAGGAEVSPRTTCVVGCVEDAVTTSTSVNAGLLATFIDSWEFDVCGATEHRGSIPLVDFQTNVMYHIFFNSQIGTGCSRVMAPREVVLEFTHALQMEYNEVPYHSYSHACDVAHTIYLMLAEVHCEAWLTDVERYTLLVAALGHDVGHFARNNDFLTKTSHELAIRYNDQSPLENMHCATLFQVCKREAWNVFKAMSDSDFREARKLCVAAILHTDMVHHPEMQLKLGMLYERTSRTCDRQAQDFDALREDFEREVLNAEHDFLAQSVLLHMADVSNPTKPFPICKKWALACLEEFWQQGDEEKRLGVPVGFLNDRTKVSVPSSQHGFIVFLVAPVFVSLASVFHSLLPMVGQMVVNLESWRDLRVEEENPSEQDLSKVAGDIAKLQAKVQALGVRSWKKKKAYLVRGGPPGE